MKRIMLIGGGIQEIPAVKTAQSLGYSVLVTDKNDNAPCFEYADRTAVIDGRDIERLIFEAFMYKVSAVFTMTELVTSVAAVSDSLNLRGANLYSAVCCQHKYLAFLCMACAEIPTPTTIRIQSKGQARRVLVQMGGQAFVKPVIGFGGRGASRIERWDQLTTDYIGDYIIQEYLEGTHYDANGLFADGEFIPLGITQRWFEGTKEIKIQSPSSLLKKREDELYELLRKAALAVGIDEGPVKCDAMLALDEEFKILELAPRLHGPKATLYTLPASGIHPLRPTLRYLVGDEITDDWNLFDGWARMENYGEGIWRLQNERIGYNIQEYDFGG